MTETKLSKERLRQIRDRVHGLHLGRAAKDPDAEAICHALGELLDLRAKVEKTDAELEQACADALTHYQEADAAESENRQLREALRAFREFIDIEYGRDDSGEFHSLTVQEIWNRLHDAFPWLRAAIGEKS